MKTKEHYSIVAWLIGFGLLCISVFFNRESVLSCFLIQSLKYFCLLSLPTDLAKPELTIVFTITFALKLARLFSSSLRKDNAFRTQGEKIPSCVTVVWDTGYNWPTILKDRTWKTSIFFISRTDIHAMNNAKLLRFFNVPKFIFSINHKCTYYWKLLGIWS